MFEYIKIFEKILEENCIYFDAVTFTPSHNEFAGKSTAEFVNEEKRLRALAEAVDAENNIRLEKVLKKIENANLSEKAKSVLRTHAKIVFDNQYSKLYLSDEEMEIIA